uniref:Uncharacterized protein n=1 Tax=Plectus sambesii TaxID=2011161 RepID=A0A914VB85_9BILA
MYVGDATTSVPYWLSPSSTTTYLGDILTSTDSNGATNGQTIGLCSSDITAGIKQAGDEIGSLIRSFSGAVMPLASVGLLLNLGVSALIIYGLYRKTLPTKRFIFLLNRAVLDAVTCLVVIIVVGVRRNHPHAGNTEDVSDSGGSDNPAQHEAFANSTTTDSTTDYPWNDTSSTLVTSAPDTVFVPFGTSMLSIIVQLNFWALCTTFGCLAALTFIAIRFPIFYHTRLTSRACVTVMLVLLAIGIGYAVLYEEFGTTPFITLEYEDPAYITSYVPSDNVDRSMTVAVIDAAFIGVVW